MNGYSIGNAHESAEKLIDLGSEHKPNASVLPHLHERLHKQKNRVVVHHGYTTSAVLSAAVDPQPSTKRAVLHSRSLDKVAHNTTRSTSRDPLGYIRNIKRLYDLPPTKRRPARLRITIFPTRPAQPAIHSLLLPLLPALVAPRSRLSRSFERRKIFFVKCALRPTERASCVRVEEARKDAHNEWLWCGRRRDG